MRTNLKRSRHGAAAPRLLTSGSRRHQRRREVFKVRPNPALDEPTGESQAAVPSSAAPEQNFMLVENISQLSDNYDLVEAVACSLFDQIALPRR